jgi:hypothetical protein
VIIYNTQKSLGSFKSLIDYKENIRYFFTLFICELESRSGRTVQLRQTYLCYHPDTDIHYVNHYLEAAAVITRSERSPAEIS